MDVPNISQKYLLNFSNFLRCHLNLRIDLNLQYSRDWLTKFATGLNTIIGCNSKSIWVIKLTLCQIDLLIGKSFCQNDSLIRESFWQNNNLVTHILFELQLIIIFSPVANFGDQSLEWWMRFTCYPDKSFPDTCIQTNGQGGYKEQSHANCSEFGGMSLDHSC